LINIGLKRSFFLPLERSDELEKKFGEIGEIAWRFSVSDPISLLSPVIFFDPT